MRVLCDYCSRPTVFLPTSETLYGKNLGPRYVCYPCDAWIGCRPGTNVPVGRLANHELRLAKTAVHKLLDPLWCEYWRAYPETRMRSRRMLTLARERAYAWLAEQLGIPADECHLSTFDLDRCRAALEVFERERPTPATVRAWAKEGDRAYA